MTEDEIGPVAGLKVQKRAVAVVEALVAVAEVFDDHTARRLTVPDSGEKTRGK